MEPVLTIAGSDCSGGAGIQADLKTMTAHGVYGMSAITALTAQNTQGVSGIHTVPRDFLEEQLHRIFEDIRPRSVKIGMLGSVELTEGVVASLKQYEPEFVVVDPVMVATSGANLGSNAVVQKMKEVLLPLADLITPNLYELEVLMGCETICTREEMVREGLALAKEVGVDVLVKGGHLVGDASDVLCMKSGEWHWFEGVWYEVKDTHGTGCTLSSAIASNWALGYSLVESIRRSKAYVTKALCQAPGLGKGNGPLNHCIVIEENPLDERVV